MNSLKAEKIMAATGALIGWFAIIVQLLLMIQNRVTALPETIIRFFSFFTILTNIMVAICFTMQLKNNRSEKTNFWFSPEIKTAIAVYIAVVGIVYNLVLRSLWSPDGMQKIVDELLHLVIPILFFLYWIIFVPKQNLKWKNALGWLWFPFVYLVYTLIRGAVTDHYPYPFLDAYNHGYPKVIKASFVILLLFLLLSSMFIAAGRFFPRKSVH